MLQLYLQLMLVSFHRAIKQRTTTYALIFIVHRARFADHIIMLGTNGSILDQGSFEDLASTNKTVQAFKALEGKEIASTDIVKDISEPKPSFIEQPSDEKKQALEDINRRTGDLSVYGYYLKSIGWPLVLLQLALISILTFSSIFPRM